MKIGIMQPYFFPYIGYWQLLAYVDQYVVYDDVTYIKGGWISRNNILLDGQKHMITLPLDNPSSFRRINEIAITENNKAREKVLKTIEQAYRKAPHYDEVMPTIRSLIMDSTGIAELNIKTVQWVCEYLDLKTKILVSSQLDKNNDLKGQDKVIDIVKLLGGDTYVNAIGGKALYDKTEFHEHGIILQFLRSGDLIYPQLGGAFVSGLSIIDLLMFCNKVKIKEYLQCFSME